MIIPENLLAGKKILLGLSGSIAVYKSLELVRHFVKAGAEVKVVMSDASKKFVTPLSFETLSRNKVLDEANESWADDHNHIKTVQWADLFVIAPCTANTISKLANGIADNMLLQCALAYPDLKLIAPSANTNMLDNPITQNSLKILQASNYEIVDTQIKELACQTTGDGAMADPIDIFWYSARTLLKDPFWVDREVMVTGGGTVEKIDDVRYLSNYSSGKMASSLATALFLKGADVKLIATRMESDLPKLVRTIVVESSEEMYDVLKDAIRIANDNLQSIQKESYLFMAAAVSDFIPRSPQEGKIKKVQMGETWNLELKQNIDLLSTLDRSGVKTVAFKAEMNAEESIKNASALIDTKNVDAVCLNLLQDSSSFGTSDNQIDFITAHGIDSLPKMDKLSLSLILLEKAAVL